jgi:alpha-galactosidase
MTPIGALHSIGWSTWCTDNGLIPCYNDFCNETEVMSVADALVSSGMADLGYRYVNLDDCWAGPRAANGSITADVTRFPSGTLQPLANYLHGLGLYLGVYTDAGTTTCRGNRPGSYPYYSQDALTYASWGVDLVKMDWCGHPGNYSAPQLYGMMRDALNATGRPMVFSICEWGLYSPWLWGPSTGNLWYVSLLNLNGPFVSIGNQHTI